VQNYRADRLAGAIPAQIRVVFFQNTARVLALESYVRIRAAAQEVISSPAVDLAFLHYPIPHSPSVYSRSANSLASSYTTSFDGYVNNLALVDQTVGEILAGLEKSGLRDQTTIILSSDHWWRISPIAAGVERDHRVPLIIQLAGSREAAVCEARINTVAVAKMITDIVGGAVNTNKSLLEYLRAAEVKETMDYTPKGALLEFPAQAWAVGLAN